MRGLVEFAHLPLSDLLAPGDEVLIIYIYIYISCVYIYIYREREAAAPDSQSRKDARLPKLC